MFWELYAKIGDVEFEIGYVSSEKAALETISTLKDIRKMFEHPGMNGIPALGSLPEIGKPKIESGKITWRFEGTSNAVIIACRVISVVTNGRDVLQSLVRMRRHIK